MTPDRADSISAHDTHATATAVEGARSMRPRGRLAAVAARALYWLPVLATTVLFAQVALLGLRPALCERTRLVAAEAVLTQRHERDLALSTEIAAHLAARYDPIFVERQRRLRQFASFPAE